MIADAKVAKQMVGFVQKIQDETVDYFSKNYKILTAPTIEISEGSKFYKVIKNDSGSKSSHCFVDKSNGDIYKCASFKIPAKISRGSIFDKDFSWGIGINMYGAVYLR